MEEWNDQEEGRRIKSGKTREEGIGIRRGCRGEECAGWMMRERES
jgi:hypothetical protein